MGRPDSLKDGKIAAAAGIDDRADGGEESDTPDGAEPLGHIADNDARAECSHVGCVGVGGRPDCDEDEEAGADLSEGLAQTNAMTIGRLDIHDRLHAVVKIGAVLAKGAVVQPLL